MPQAWPKKKSYNGETNNKQQSNKQHKRKVSKDLNRHVSKDKIQMAMKHMKMFYAIRHSGDVNQIHAHETHAILFLFFFFGYTGGMQKFLGQGWKLHHSSDPKPLP